MVDYQLTVTVKVCRIRGNNHKILHFTIRVSATKEYWNLYYNRSEREYYYTTLLELPNNSIKDEINFPL